MGAYKYKKVNVDLPGQPYYKYNDVFKRKVISDIDGGLISARKSAALYNVNKKTIERWRTDLAGSGKEDLACRGEEVAPAIDGSIATLAAGPDVKGYEEEL